MACIDNAFVKLTFQDRDASWVGGVGDHGEAATSDCSRNNRHLELVTESRDK